MTDHEFQNLRLGQKIKNGAGETFTVTGIYEADPDRGHFINATKTIEVDQPKDWEVV